MKRQVMKKKRKNIKTNKQTCWLRYCMSHQLWLILTQHVQSGLLFLLSDHGQSGPVPRECCCLSLQESSLSADSWHKKTWYIIKRLLANRIFLLPTSVPFSGLYSRITTGSIWFLFTFQQSRFEVGFSDVLSVVHINLKQTKTTAQINRLCCIFKHIESMPVVWNVLYK